MEFFFASFGESGCLKTSERLLVVLRERREDFLSLKASFESSVLDLLVGRWHDW